MMLLVAADQPLQLDVSGFRPRGDAPAVLDARIVKFGGERVLERALGEALQRRELARVQRPALLRMPISCCARLDRRRDLVPVQLLAVLRVARREAEPFREHDPDLLREVGRHLAIRMSYEDIIRVAQAKGRPARFKRIKGELGTAADDPFHVTEFLKPGIQEVCDLLPPTMARRLMSWGKNSGKLKTLHWGMEVRTTTITGYIKMRILAGLRWWRPYSYRWAVEQAAIERWLALVMQAASVSTALGLEVTELARLIKGYGSTHQRGSSNYQRIVTDLVMPLLADPPPDGPERVKTALKAALAGPDGKALNQVLHSTNPPAPVAAQ